MDVTLEPLGDLVDKVVWHDQGNDWMIGIVHREQGSGLHLIMNQLPPAVVKAAMRVCADTWGTTVVHNAPTIEDEDESEDEDE